jgi:hypothetical protein
MILILGGLPTLVNLTKPASELQARLLFLFEIPKLIKITRVGNILIPHPQTFLTKFERANPLKASTSAFDNERTSLVDHED